ncbi:MAG: GrpB family protein [Clostridiales bacterium]|nr:GrpB family protein [Clostridiales bacterium]
MRRVAVAPYGDHWPAAFRRIAARLRPAVPGALAVEHVGSTSVPGLCAKPIIDIDLVIPSADRFDGARRALEAIGYRHEGDRGIAGREAFKYGALPGLMAHHLYVCAADSAELKRHIVFRDYLRAHPRDAAAYGGVKAAAAWNHPCDIQGYMDVKAPCVAALYRACGLIE